MNRKAKAALADLLDYADWHEILDALSNSALDEADAYESEYEQLRDSGASTNKLRAAQAGRASMEHIAKGLRVLREHTLCRLRKIAKPGQSLTSANRQLPAFGTQWKPWKSIT